jgi:hypothetical protein
MKKNLIISSIGPIPASIIAKKTKENENKVDDINGETEVFLNILQEWKDNDYSKGVQAHNYAWKLLHGNMGRAKELRSEYSKL